MLNFIVGNDIIVVRITLKGFLVQTFMSMVIVLLAGIVLATACILNISSITYGPSVSRSLGCLLDWTPALDAFLLFVLHGFICVSTVACCLTSISNSLVIALDIIFFFSILMLILYHTLKQSRNLFVKAV